MRNLLFAIIVMAFAVPAFSSGADPPNYTAIEVKLPDGWTFTIPNRQRLNTAATITMKGGGTFPIASADNSLLFAMTKDKKLVMIASPKAKAFGFGAGNNKLTYSIDGGEDQTDSNIRVEFDFKTTVVVELKKP